MFPGTSQARFLILCAACRSREPVRIEGVQAWPLELRD